MGQLPERETSPDPKAYAMPGLTAMPAPEAVGGVTEIIQAHGANTVVTVRSGSLAGPIVDPPYTGWWATQQAPPASATPTQYDTVVFAATQLSYDDAALMPAFVAQTPLPDALDAIAGVVAAVDTSVEYAVRGQDGQPIPQPWDASYKVASTIPPARDRIPAGSTVEVIVFNPGR